VFVHASEYARCRRLPAVALSVCLRLCFEGECGRTLGRVKGHGSWVLVGIKQDWAVACAYAWAWALGLLGVGSTAVQHSTAQY